MSRWQDVLLHLTTDVEAQFDSLKYRLSRRLDHDPIMIQPYRGLGTAQKLYVRGRVLEDEGVKPPDDNDSLWENLLNMYRRFESDEIPGARLVARFQGVEKEVVADEEGYFEVWIEPQQPLPTDRLWHEVELELVAPLREEQPVRATAQVLVPPAGVRYGVISDIDDTVLQTNATDFLRMARAVFLGNARTRLPFEGVGAFYRALHKGAGGNEQNPLFYVSSSPWNMYDLLSDFFNLQGIPVGPVLFLRDWGIEETGLPFGHTVYKLNAIEKIMELFPGLPFILVGDSGQEDPEIYEQVVVNHPQRILAVYIRNVSRDPRRGEAIGALADKVVKVGSTLILADNTLPLAEHAIAQGWIAPDSYPRIQAAKEADEAPPGPIEQLLATEPKSAGPQVVVEGQADTSVESKTEAVQEALQTGDAKTEKPPTVVVEGDPNVEPPTIPPDGEQNPKA